MNLTQCIFLRFFILFCTISFSSLAQISQSTFDVTKNYKNEKISFEIKGDVTAIFYQKENSVNGTKNLILDYKEIATRINYNQITRSEYWITENSDTLFSIQDLKNRFLITPDDFLSQLFFDANLNTKTIFDKDNQKVADLQIDKIRNGISVTIKFFQDDESQKQLVMQFTAYWSTLFLEQILNEKRQNRALIGGSILVVGASVYIILTRNNW